MSSLFLPYEQPLRNQFIRVANSSELLKYAANRRSHINVRELGQDLLSSKCGDLPFADLHVSLELSERHVTPSRMEEEIHYGMTIYQTLSRSPRITLRAAEGMGKTTVLRSLIFALTNVGDNHMKGAIGHDVVPLVLDVEKAGNRYIKEWSDTRDCWGLVKDQEPLSPETFSKISETGQALFLIDDWDKNPDSMQTIIRIMTAGKETTQRCRFVFTGTKGPFLGTETKHLLPLNDNKVNALSQKWFSCFYRTESPSLQDGLEGFLTAARSQPWSRDLAVQARVPKHLAEMCLYHATGGLSRLLPKPSFAQMNGPR